MFDYGLTRDGIDLRDGAVVRLSEQTVVERERRSSVHGLQT